MNRMPTLFLSHGSPLLAVEDSAAGRFLDGLAARLPPPRAIVVASAHYEAPHPSLGAAAAPQTVHDFRGFPPALDHLRYPAPGEPDLAARAAGLLRDAGFRPSLDAERGLDHGVWVPLRRAWPEATLPVVPLSVDPRSDARRHYALGAALAPLREEGVLVLGSGGFVHNLGQLDWQGGEIPLAPWAREFADWMHAALASSDSTAALDWATRAPHAGRAHPTVEHLMPLFVALGAAGPSPRVERLHRSHEFGSLALEAYRFD